MARYVHGVYTLRAIFGQASGEKGLLGPLRAMRMRYSSVPTPPFPTITQGGHQAAISHHGKAPTRTPGYEVSRTCSGPIGSAAGKVAPSIS